MAVNKVKYGDEVIIDISDSTVTEDTLAEGVTAYAANGEKITGSMPTTPVLYTEQTLSDEQKAQARKNIDALGNNISLGIHTDGLLYVFVDGKPVGTGIPYITYTPC